MSLRIHPASVESSAGSAAPLAAPLATRLTDRLKLRHPVMAAGGRLAASVSAAGGLGLIGGGYGDADWLTRELRAAGNQQEAARWRTAWEAGDTDTANTFVGEVTGLIDSIEPATVLLERMVNEALQVLKRYPQA